MKQLRYYCMLLSAASVSLLFSTCKKEIREQAGLSPPSHARTVGSALGAPVEFDEQDLSDFIGDVIYYHNHPLDDRSVATLETIDLMEAGVNYVFSDIDTAFEDYDTTLNYSFELPINVNDEYNMQDVQEEMYAIKAIIKGREEESIDGGVKPRFMTACIEEEGVGKFVITLLFGKAYDSPPSQSDEPEAPSVATGTYVWETTNHGACLDNTVPMMQAEGEAYFLARQNHYILNALYWPTGKKAYFNGNGKIVRSRTMNNILQTVDFVSWDDVSASTSGFPTSMANPGPRPNQNAMFVKSTDLYVTMQTGLGGIVLWFQYCMNQDYINWYIAQMPAVFDNVRAASNHLPLAGIGPGGVPNFRVGHGIASNDPALLCYENMRDENEIYHQYFFRYTALQFATLNNGYNTSY